eukprot:SAG22_NODE_422_length_10687_cov_4.448149_5_plen_284_part_00
MDILVTTKHALFGVEFWVVVVAPALSFIASCYMLISFWMDEDGRSSMRYSVMYANIPMCGFFGEVAADPPLEPGPLPFSPCVSLLPFLAVRSTVFLTERAHVVVARLRWPARTAALMLMNQSAHHTAGLSCLQFGVLGQVLYGQMNLWHTMTVDTLYSLCEGDGQLEALKVSCKALVVFPRASTRIVPQTVPLFLAVCVSVCPCQARKIFGIKYRNCVHIVCWGAPVLLTTVMYMNNANVFHTDLWDDPDIRGLGMCGACSVRVQKDCSNLGHSDTLTDLCSP